MVACLFIFKLFSTFYCALDGLTMNSLFFWLSYIIFQVIGINGQFPGPILNVTTNWNVVVNVKNNLDEPLLLTWYKMSESSQIASNDNIIVNLTLYF